MIFSQNFNESNSKFFLLELEEPLKEPLTRDSFLEIKRDERNQTAFLVSKSSTYALSKKEIANTMFISKPTEDQREEVQTVTQFNIVARKFRPIFSNILEELDQLTLDSHKTNIFPKIEDVLKKHIISEDELLKV
jgi:hypothetical protein